MPNEAVRAGISAEITVKRWLILLLVGLAVLLLLSPGLIGRLAETTIDQGLTVVDLESPSLSITSESFQRGWFTSEGTHRITFDGRRLTGGIQNDGEEAAGDPSLIFETRLDHGPLPVTSLGRDSGTLRPALVSAVSSVAMDRGNGEIIELPATLYSVVGFGGGTTLRLLVEEGTDTYGNARTEWQGADLTYVLSADGLEEGFAGTVEPFSITFWDISTVVGDMTISSERDRRRHPVGEGSVDFALDSLKVRMPGEDDTVVGPLVFQFENRVDGDRRVEGGGRIEIDAGRLGAVGELAFDAVFAVEGFDADGLRQMIDAGRVLYGSSSLPPPDELALADAIMRQGQEAVLRRGGRIVIESADVELPEGNANLSLSLDVQASQRPVSPADLPSLLLRTSGTLHLQFAEGMLDYLPATFDPDLTVLQAGGYLLPAREGYETRIEIDNGRLTINGAPLNLPALLSQ